MHHVNLVMLTLVDIHWMNKDNRLLFLTPTTKVVIISTVCIVIVPQRKYDSMMFRYVVGCHMYESGSRLLLVFFMRLLFRRRRRRLRRRIRIPPVVTTEVCCRFAFLTNIHLFISTFPSLPSSLPSPPTHYITNKIKLDGGQMWSKIRFLWRWS